MPKRMPGWLWQQEQFTNHDSLSFDFWSQSCKVVRNAHTRGVDRVLSILQVFADVCHEFGLEVKEASSTTICNVMEQDQLWGASNHLLRGSDWLTEQKPSRAL